jgi:hypothetical protein
MMLKDVKDEKEFNTRFGRAMRYEGYKYDLMVLEDIPVIQREEDEEVYRQRLEAWAKLQDDAALAAIKFDARLVAHVGIETRRALKTRKIRRQP